VLLATRLVKLSETDENPIIPTTVKHASRINNLAMLCSKYILIFLGRYRK
jgi:hypothetical protein